VKELVGKTVVEVKEIEIKSRIYHSGHKSHWAEGFLVRCSDGTEIAVTSKEYHGASFSNSMVVGELEDYEGKPTIRDNKGIIHNDSEVVFM